MDHKTLIVGATGNVGGRLAEILTSQGHGVKAASCQPARYAGPPNAEAVAFDLDQSESFGPALQGDWVTR